jgi:hypothetical protein
MPDKLRFSVGTYGNYSSDNYSGHCLKIWLGSLMLYFSYKTVIAFEDGHNDCQVSENLWGPTTGKHLNWIDGGDKKSRLKRDKFEELLNDSLKKHGLEV